MFISTTTLLIELLINTTHRFKHMYCRQHGDIDVRQPKYIVAIYLLCCQSKRLPAQKKQVREVWPNKSLTNVQAAMRRWVHTFRLGKVCSDATN